MFSFRFCLAWVPCLIPLREWMKMKRIFYTLLICVLAICANGCSSTKTAKEWFDQGVNAFNDSEKEEAKQCFQKAERNYFPTGELALEMWFTNSLKPQNTGVEINQALEQIQINEIQGIKILQQFADKGNPQAKYYYGYALYYGLIVPRRNEQEGLKYLKQAADAGITEAAFCYALTGISLESFYCTPSLHVNKERSKDIVHYLHKEAQKGYAPAQCMLGNLFFEKKNKNNNFKKGAEYFFNLAAEQDYAPAIHMQAIMYCWGYTNQEERKKGIDLMGKAANLNFAPAQYYFGEKLLDSNEKTGLKWIQKAADNGEEYATQYIWDHSFMGKTEYVLKGAGIIFIGIPLFIVTIPIQIPLHLWFHRHDVYMGALMDRYDPVLIDQLTEINDKIPDPSIIQDEVEIIQETK